MKKAVITGTSGFLGRNLACALLERDVRVIAVVRDAGSLTDIKCSGLEIIEADIRDYAMLGSLIPAGDYDVFYHFAWAGTSGTERENCQIQLCNIKAACDAVTAARQAGCRKFVNAGSLMEYESIEMMNSGGRKPDGNYLYRSAKLAAHYMAETEAAKAGLPFVNMIISNVYGAGEISERLISSTQQKLLRDEAVSFTAGNQPYDFIYIDDAAEAFYQTGRHGRAFHNYYIGSGQIRPLREYMIELHACLARKQKPEFGAVSHDGISLDYSKFDMDALKRETGFRCRVSFSEGIQKAYKWMGKRHGTGMELQDI